MKNKMKKVAALLVLSGAACAASAGVMDDLTQFYVKHAGLDKVTAVIPPGHKAMLGDKTIMVSGLSTCPVEPLPGSKGIWVLGMSNDAYAQMYAGLPGCIVVGPHTSKVSVVLYEKIDGRLNRYAEDWTVQHGIPQHEDAIVMKRPNGEYVSDAR
ncbi:hypothetical protein [Ralstonia pseudosolanacearum]|uniref:hypothetical protein n=1 Tax=Ralstonia pseudosolanacearum TaxID=1310165 RepID=UPI003CF1D0D9